MSQSEDSNKLLFLGLLKKQILDGEYEKVKSEGLAQLKGTNAVLDLHEVTQDEAYSLILKILSSEIRSAVIITGKSGILKQIVPIWLETEPFKSKIKIQKTTESAIKIKKR